MSWLKRAKNAFLLHSATMHPLAKVGMVITTFGGFIYTTWDWRWQERPTRKGKVARVRRSDRNASAASSRAASPRVTLTSFPPATALQNLRPTPRIESARSSG